MLQTMVADWRVKLGNPTLAFGAVLLAAWKGGDPASFPLLRLAQANLTNHVADTFVVSAIDMGDRINGAVHGALPSLAAPPPLLLATNLHHRLHGALFSKRFFQLARSQACWG
jgi:hypothetical protein